MFSRVMITHIHPFTLPECKNESSKISNSPSTRIAHGDDANEGEAPYQVLIIARDDIGKSTEAAQQCSGSLVRLNFLLTAAHCLLRKDADNIVEKYELFAGSSNLLSPNQYLEVWTQTCSPGCVFIPSGYKNDPDPYIKLSRGDGKSHVFMCITLVHCIIFYKLHKIKPWLSRYWFN